MKYLQIKFILLGLNCTVDSRMWGIVEQQHDKNLPCCKVCNTDEETRTEKIKVYSIDHFFEHCGEACIDEKDFWKLKIFETGLHKAEGKKNPCAKFGYTIFKHTETHGIDVHELYMTQDFYDKPQDFKDIDAESDHDMELHHLDEMEELSDHDLMEIDHAA